MSTGQERPAPPPFPSADSVPSELRPLKRWIGWKGVWDDSKKKWRKPPHSSITGEAIGATEKWAEHWVTFDEALAGAQERELDGVGFVFKKGDGFVGVDFDDCVADGEITPEARSWLNWFPSYTEYSPSGAGVHIICRGELDRALTAKPLAHGVATAEAYGSDRYFTFTGKKIGNFHDVADCRGGIDKLVKTLGADETTATEQHSRPMLRETIRRLHDENLVALRSAGQGEGNALLNTAAFFAGKAFATGALDGTAETIKKQLLDIVTREWKSPHPEMGARSTISSGWAAGAEDPFTLAEDEWPEKTRTVEEFNKKFYVVRSFGNRCRVCWEEKDTHIKGRGFVLCQQSFPDFKNGFMNQLVQVGIKMNAAGDAAPKYSDKATVWLNSPNRRQYESIVFLPNAQAAPDVRNLWRGFAFEPRKGDCTLYLSHLRDNVCKGDETKYRYLIGWMAYAVRNPHEQGHVAVVIQGEKGVGKNVAAEGFSRLWGQHAITVSDQQRITGNFNAHLRDKCVLICDEAFFAGDKRHEGVLKSIVTGSELNIEPKGVDSITVPNLLHIIVLGNDRWLVPATFEERRFFFVRCASTRIQDKAYFRAIQQQLDRGGYEALLHYLMLEVDLSSFEVREAPRTQELVSQMVETLRDVDAAWHECVYTGVIPGRLEKNGSVLLRLEDFINWAAAQKSRRWANLKPQHLGDLLGIDPRNPTRSFNFGRHQMLVKNKRRRFWVVPPLSEVRETWDKIRMPVEWPDDGGEWDAVAGMEYDY